MPETKQIAFSHREVVEMLIKNQDIHDGFWGIMIEFGFGAGAFPAPPKGNPVPGAIVQVSRIGIQKFDQPVPESVNAAEVNPRTEGAGTTVPALPVTKFK